MYDAPTHAESGQSSDVLQPAGIHRPIGSSQRQIALGPQSSSTMQPRIHSRYLPKGSWLSLRSPQYQFSSVQSESLEQES